MNLSPKATGDCRGIMNFLAELEEKTTIRVEKHGLWRTMYMFPLEGNALRVVQLPVTGD